jgi:hypothetical protein
MPYRSGTVADTKLGNFAQVQGWLPLCGALYNVQAT